MGFLAQLSAPVIQDDVFVLDRHTSCHELADGSDNVAGFHVPPRIVVLPNHENTVVMSVDSLDKVMKVFEVYVIFRTDILDRPKPLW